MFQFQADTTGLEAVASRLAGAAAAIDAAIPPALNDSGARLSSKLARGLADRLSEGMAVSSMSEQEVASAFDVQHASAAMPAYVITVGDRHLPYVRWFTQLDERVCKVCGPRHGRIYRQDEALTLWPAHMNCRCRLEPVNASGEAMSLAADLLPEAQEEAADSILSAFATYWGA